MPVRLPHGSGAPSISHHTSHESHGGMPVQLIINQQPCEFSDPTVDVSTLLQSRGVKPDSVALAINGHVVPRRTWPAVKLTEGDRVELVKVVAGGAHDDDALVIDGRTFASRLFMGTGRCRVP